MNMTTLKNKNISMNTRIDDIVGELTEIIEVLQEYPHQHYRKEYVYNVRALINELGQEIQGRHFSIDYILEKVSKLVDCARIIKNER